MGRVFRYMETVMITTCLIAAVGFFTGLVPPPSLATVAAFAFASFGASFTILRKHY